MLFTNVLKIIIIFSFISIRAFAQRISVSSEYKQTVRIGIYVSPKMSLHTQIITDIAHNYEKLNPFVKKNIDDLFEGYFKTNAQLIALELNTAYDKSGPQIIKGDTLFEAFAKIENVEDADIPSIIKRDSLDYFVGVQNINSIAFNEYFKIEFLEKIQSKIARRDAINKKIAVAYINQSTKTITDNCFNPYECLKFNFIKATTKSVSEKLFEDGYRQGSYSSYKKYFKEISK